ncbi:MAG: hypothetical protein JO202_14520 [Ktedonobacteraceae bacterium]|nr:hypothetical protein [Ktedonobacteraceae bacterium]
MSDQMQDLPVVPVLSALLAHPEVQAGLLSGQAAFQDGVFSEEHAHAWTERDMIQFVEGELSGKQYRREQRIDQALGYPSLSYLYRLGFVISYLSQTLAAQAP